MLKLNLAFFLSFSLRANRQVHWITYSHYNEEWQGNCGSTPGIWWLCQYPFFLYMSMYMSHDCPYVSCTHVLNNLIIWLALWTGKMDQIALCDWPPEWARWSYIYPLGITRGVPREKFPLKPNNKSFIDQAVLVKIAGYCLTLFLQVYIPPLCLGP